MSKKDKHSFVEDDIIAREYTTLEQDLTNVFRDRNIEVERITVSNGARKYLIEVKR